MSPRIIRKDRGDWHSYTIDSHKALGVTTVTGTLPKKALPAWAGRMVADRALDEWETLTQLAPSERHKRLTSAHGDALRAAGERGKTIHALAEKIVAGEPVAAPDEVLGPAEALARFYDDWSVEPLATEVTVGHPGLRVAGTVDLIANVARLHPDLPVLIDTKTGSGPWESDALQVVAYSHMSLWQPRGPESEEAMPALGGAYVAKVLTDTVEVYPVLDMAEGWRVFRHVLEVRRWLDRLRDAPAFDSPVALEPVP